jgi:hypothetical protein
MRTREFICTALLALLPTAIFAAEGSLRGSPESMTRQHGIALEEDLSFARTPKAVLKEVEAGILTPLPGNADYRTANVSFAYAVPEVRMLVERLAKEYRATCGEQLVVTSLTRPQTQQPRNAHALSVHPAGLAVDLRISKRTECRAWLERTLLDMENKQLLDVTRERRPPHYHVAVFATSYRTFVEHQDSVANAVLAQKTVKHAPVTHSAMAVLPARRADPADWIVPLLYITTCAFTAFGLLRGNLKRR